MRILIVTLALFTANNVMCAFQRGETQLKSALRWALTGSTTSTTTTIKYHGGPIMNGVPVVNIYTIFYGSWANSTAQIIIDFFNGISGTTYWNIQKKYIGNIGVKSGGYVYDNYTLGKTNPNITSIISKYISNGKFPNDPYGIYFVLTFNDVSVSGFCSKFCGYHNYMNRLKYSFVGASTVCGGCSPYSYTPNNDKLADTTVNVISHELVETLSDPYFNAWYSDQNGYENSDLCSWNYGTMTNNYNVQTTKRKYAIQTNFDITSNSCKNYV